MAIYHHSIKIVSRGKGKSAVAAAAYRAGETLTNEYDGITHDYTRKGGVVHTEIILPENAPPEYQDRATLWNAVEKCERYKTAQLAREVEIALPVELTREQNIALVRKYVRSNFTAAGMCADVAIHDKGDGNPHAHIMLTVRAMDERGVWAAKSKTVNGKKIPTVDWNEQTKAEQWRAAWAELCNQVLEQNNHTERIDHRSFARQGIDIIPSIHLGVAASQMERRGIRTERGNVNRQIEISNNELQKLKARTNKLRDWLKTEQRTDAPTLYDIIGEILNGNESQNRSAKIRDLKTAAGILAFMQSNNITTIDELRGKVTDFYGRLSELNDRLKPIDRRLKTLDEHIRQSETAMKHRAVYKQYQTQKPKNKEAFYESHRAEITLYEAANRYLKDHLNGRTAIPLKAWKAERVKLAATRSSLNTEYQSLKSEIKEVETIRKYAEEIQRSIEPKQKMRKNEIEI